MSSSDIYRKTEQGQEEVRTRRGGLDARSRTLLILANGELSVAALGQRMGLDVLPLVTELVSQGLLERAAGKLARAPEPPRSAAPPKSTAPAPTEPPAPAVDPAQREQALRQAKARIMPLLEPLFGPNAADMARPLLAAGSRDAYLAAMRELTDTLAIYRGKKGAADLVRPLLEGL